MVHVCVETLQESAIMSSLKLISIQLAPSPTAGEPAYLWTCMCTLPLHPYSRCHLRHTHHRHTQCVLHHHLPHTHTSAHSDLCTRLHQTGMTTENDLVVNLQRCYILKFSFAVLFTFLMAKRHGMFLASDYNRDILSQRVDI